MVEKKHNYFYKITNLVNGKYYYGIHSTNNLEDGYFGSGLALKKAIKKYGKENFTKEIIADYPTRKEAAHHEERVVVLEVVLSKDCYNLKTGGVETNYHTDNTKRKIGEASRGRIHTQETKLLISKANSGKKPTEEHKEKNRLAHLGTKLTKEHIDKLIKINTGSKRGVDTKTKISDKLKGNNNGIKNKVVVFGLVFDSLAECGRYHGLAASGVNRRLNSSKYPDWSYYVGDCK